MGTPITSVYSTNSLAVLPFRPPYVCVILRLRFSFQIGTERRNYIVVHQQKRCSSGQSVSQVNVEWQFQENLERLCRLVGPDILTGGCATQV